jgi:hypothetical protein
MPSGSQRSMVPTLTSCGMPRGTPSLESAARSIRYTATPSDVGPYRQGTFISDAPDDRDWAVETWRSLRHRG